MIHGARGPGATNAISGEREQRSAIAPSGSSTASAAAAARSAEPPGADGRRASTPALGALRAPTADQGNGGASAAPGPPAGRATCAELSSPCPPLRGPALRAPALALCLAFLAGRALGEETLVDGIAAQVGPEIVLVSEVLELAGPIEAEARQQGASERDVAKLRADALEQLIERRLLSKVARDAHLEATDADVDAAIAGIGKDNGLSQEQLRASLAAHGVRWDEYRERIKSEIERQKVITAMVGSQITVEEPELEAAYREIYSEQPKGGEQVHIKQILVLGGEAGPRDLPSACAIARDARARIAKGEPFATVAQEVSVAAPEQGGDIGWLHVDTMAGWMADPLQHLEPGAVSPVIELPFGCTLFELVERKSYEPVTFEQAKGSLQQELYQRKVMEKYREWMEGLRKRTFISRRGYFAENPSATASARPAGLAQRAQAGPDAAEEPAATP